MDADCSKNKKEIVITTIALGKCKAAELDGLAAKLFRGAPAPFAGLLLPFFCKC